MTENLQRWQLSLATRLFIRLCTVVGGRAVWRARAHPGPPALLPICGGGRLPAGMVARQLLWHAACQGQTTAPRPNNGSGAKQRLRECCQPGRQDNPPPRHHRHDVCNEASHAWDGRSDVKDFIQSGVIECRKYLILPFVSAKISVRGTPLLS